MNYIGVNGVNTPAAEAVISVMDHGFLYGIGLFETMRTYGGAPFLLERHLFRLEQGCKQLGIEYTGDLHSISEEIQNLLQANELEEGYIRYTVSAGEDVLGLPSGNYTRPQRVLYVKPLPPFPSSLYETGRELKLLHTRRNTPEGPVRFKSLHYMNNILAKRELTSYTTTDSVAPEGLLLTSDGWLAEGIVSNIFFVSSGQLYTPSIQTGILPGITRELVIKLAEGLGMKTEEGLYTWDMLIRADEIFLTNSIQEIVPVTSLSKLNSAEEPQRVGSGRIGPITEQLLRLYQEKARLN